MSASALGRDPALGAEPGVGPVDHAEEQHGERQRERAGLGADLADQILDRGDDPPLLGDHLGAARRAARLSSSFSSTLWLSCGADIEPHERQGQRPQLLLGACRSRGRLARGLDQGVEMRGHDRVEDVVLGREIVIDQRLGGVAGLGEVGHRRARGSRAAHKAAPPPRGSPRGACRNRAIAAGPSLLRHPRDGGESSRLSRPSARADGVSAGS